jgi:hypothetical protein
MRSSWWIAVVVALGACGATYRDAVRETLDEETRPDNWHKLRVPMRELAGDIARGVVDAAGASQLAPAIDAAIDRFVRTTLHAAAEDLDAELSPAIARSVRASIDAALAAMRSDGTRRGVEDITDAVTAAAMAGLARGIRQQIAPALAHTLDAALGPALQRVLENQLGPAAAKMLQRDLGPAMAATLERDLAPALADVARRASSAAGEGFVDGVRRRAEPWLDQSAGKLQTAMDGVEQRAHAFLPYLVVAIVAGFSGVLLVVLWLRHRAAATSRVALQLITKEIARLGAEPGVLELTRRIKAVSHGTRAGAVLAEQLPAHPADPR